MEDYLIATQKFITVEGMKIHCKYIHRHPPTKSAEDIFPPFRAAVAGSSLYVFSRQKLNSIFQSMYIM